MTNPWDKYAIGRNSPRLTEVSHVAHLQTAKRIVEDGKIRAGIVSARSRLATDRTCVVWLSANTWSDGYRYGNVRFTYDWLKVRKGKHAYWVEAATEYSVTACRILLTDKSHQLPIYDPKVAGGPWVEDVNGAHFWNGDVCLELVLEDDLKVADATSVDFVKHHDDFCSRWQGGCGDKGLEWNKAAAIFVGHFTAAGAPVTLPNLSGSPLANDMGAAAVTISRILKTAGGGFGGSMKATDALAHPVMRAFLRGLESPALAKDRQALASHFQDHDEAWTAAKRVIEAAFRLPPFVLDTL